MEDCDNRKNDFDENNPDYDPLQLAGASLQDCRNTSVQEELSKNTYRQAYYYLFNQITDMIRRLQYIQEEVEELFINEENDGEE